MNTALVFLKPHATNAKCAALVEGRLAEAGVQVVSKGTVGAAKIDAGQCRKYKYKYKYKYNSLYHSTTTTTTTTTCYY